MSHCGDFAVEVVCSEPIDACVVKREEVELLKDDLCWLREVVLTGDGMPWVIGRTLMTLESMDRSQYDISQQGTVPIGVTIFSHSESKRDALQVASIETPQGVLYARRSRLWMNEHPILVAELFLPASPIYQMESMDDLDKSDGILATDAHG